LTPAAIRWFVRHYEVDLAEAGEQDPAAYPSFDAFFTRALRPGARPIAPGAGVVVSPVDGTISQLGRVTDGRIVQAKGQSFDAQELLGGDGTRAAPYTGGYFATIYLSPRDYHRIHMPLDGQLIGMVHVPGRLFSVAPYAVRTIPRIYGRNERVAALFETPVGPMAVVMVGAINVGAIETVWAGLVTPPHGAAVRVWSYQGSDRSVRLAKGDEMGRFNLGSTVILLLPDCGMEWLPELRPGSTVRLGQPLGHAEPPNGVGDK
jgi:phosphatidylserine decarboxylase